ncbi:MAG: porin [Saprospiraceae bacterium]|nr:porin [Saprospiraceae bacterium]
MILISLLSFSNTAWSQISSDSQDRYNPIIFNLNEDGSQYIRLIMWHQIWLTTNNLSDKNSNFQLSPSIRRSRMLAFAQLSPDLLILTHFGLNGLTTSNLTPTGNNGDGPQIFLHGAWAEYRINDYLYAGGGLHYWNGLTRLSSQSTLNFMTLDQSRPFTSWHSLGVTDQFARHLGIYLKGEIGKFDYRLAYNSPLKNNTGEGKDFGIKDSGLTYNGFNYPNLNGNATGNAIFSGYFRYNLFDKESIKLPYMTGTYLGKKRVVAIGAGFFSHPNGMFHPSSGVHSNVSHMAVDGYVDIPVNNGAFHAYASYIDFDYGNNYVSRWAGTGHVYYVEAGYYFAPYKVMPYAAFNQGMYDGLNDKINALDIGVNYFIKSHNAKVTLEYHSIKGDIREATIFSSEDAHSQLRFQLHLFI